MLALPHKFNNFDRHVDRLYGGKSQTKRIRTFSKNKELVGYQREKIVNSLSRVFIKKGFDRTNLRELTHAVGMSGGSIYHYIGSKEDVLYLVINQAEKDEQKFVETMIEKVEKLSPTDALTEAIKTFYEQVDKQQDRTIFINHVLVNLDRQTRRSVFSLENAFLDFFEMLLKRGIQEGEFRMNLPSLVAFNILISGREWALRRWFLAKHLSLQQYTKEQTEIILRSIRV